MKTLVKDAIASKLNSANGCSPSRDGIFKGDTQHISPREPENKHNDSQVRPTSFRLEMQRKN